jgi:hypothetical protein
MPGAAAGPAPIFGAPADDAGADEIACIGATGTFGRLRGLARGLGRRDDTVIIGRVCEFDVAAFAAGAVAAADGIDWARAVCGVPAINAAPNTNRYDDRDTPPLTPMRT